jgi:hypothetical protein
MFDMMCMQIFKRTAPFTLANFTYFAARHTFHSRATLGNSTFPTKMVFASWRRA